MNQDTKNSHLHHHHLHNHLNSLHHNTLGSGSLVMSSVASVLDKQQPNINQSYNKIMPNNINGKSGNNRIRSGSDSSDAGCEESGGRGSGSGVNTTGTVDSGRWSDSDENASKSSPAVNGSHLSHSSSDAETVEPTSLENQKNRNEDIFIYIPASKPPVVASSGVAPKSDIKKPTVVQVLPKNHPSSVGSLSLSLNNSSCDSGNRDLEEEVFEENFSLPPSLLHAGQEKDLEVNLTKFRRRSSQESSEDEGETRRSRRSCIITSNFMMKSREAVIASSRPQRSHRSDNPLLSLFDQANDRVSQGGDSYHYGHQSHNKMLSDQNMCHKQNKSHSLLILDVNNKNKEKKSTETTLTKDQVKKKSSGLSSYFFSGTISRCKSSKSLEYLNKKQTTAVSVNQTNSTDGKEVKNNLYSAYKKNHNSFIKKGHSNCGLYSSSSTTNLSSSHIPSDDMEPTDIDSDLNHFSIISVSNGCKNETKADNNRVERAWF